jgi:hypothetical protein
VVAVDPGTAKCGVAVVRRGAAGGPPAVLYREVTDTASVASIASRLITAHGAGVVLVGDATGGRAVRDTLAAVLGPDGPVLIPVPEAHTSRRARERYLRENPPRSAFARLLPLGLRTPDAPYDDYVAVLLAEAYLASG